MLIGDDKNTSNYRNSCCMCYNAYSPSVAIINTMNTSNDKESIPFQQSMGLYDIFT